MASWVRALLDQSPGMLLAGHCLRDVTQWQAVFARFWDLYRCVNPNHCIYVDGLDTRNCIPYFMHGDEGRGYCRRPFMVESFQPVISRKGLEYTNESGKLDLDCATFFIDFLGMADVKTYSYHLSK